MHWSLPLRDKGHAIVEAFGPFNSTVLTLLFFLFLVTVRFNDCVRESVQDGPKK